MNAGERSRGEAAGAASDTMRCDYCPAPAVFFEPGLLEVRNLFLLRREVPMRCWCFEHWVTEFGAAKQEPSL